MRKRQSTEIDEDNMASRLQLDLGMFIDHILGH
jgi:hypothetical protein